MADPTGTEQVSTGAASTGTSTNGAVGGVSTATPSVGGAGTASVSTGTPAYTFGGKTYGSADELGKAYESLQSEHGKWTQKYGDLEKQFNQTNQQAQAWNQWWQQIQPLWGQDVENFLLQKMQRGGKEGQQAAQQLQQMQQGGQQSGQYGQQGQMGQQQQGQQGQAGQQRNPFEGFEMMRPEEQYGRLRDMIQGDLGQKYQQQLGQALQQIDQGLKQKEAWYQNYLQNYLGLMRKAFDRRLTDPTFNVDQAMEQAAKAMSGQMDPLELGQQLMASGELAGKLEAARKDAYAQGQKDTEQAAANKKMEGAIPGTSSPVYKVNATPPGTRHGLATMRQKAAEDIIKKFGSGIFTE